MRTAVPLSPAAPAVTGEAVMATGIEKAFGDAPVLRGVDLTVPAGRLVALLGPSGCGKTTLLRTIAGLERPDAGEVRVGARILSGHGTFTPPEKRRIGMVFQDAALFPHLSVGRNVAYGLPRRDPRRAERVAAALALVGLTGFADRAPATLSGGQAQRVALARALAPEPSVILLDEPFSGLDAPLRAELRLEVRRVLAETGATGIFVTHDQEEAFVVGDEVAVMQVGLILQQAAAATLYELPVTREVAEFVGDANLVDGVGDGDVARTPVGPVPLHAPRTGPLQVMIRPERLLAEPGGGATVEAVEYFGHDAVYRVRLADGEVVRSRVIGAPSLTAGDAVTLAFTGAPTDAYRRS